LHLNLNPGRYNLTGTLSNDVIVAGERQRHYRRFGERRHRSDGLDTDTIEGNLGSDTLMATASDDILEAPRIGG
jgi:hypothetical protein